jgi:cytoskeletal protein CcmA (bactofilin family)
MASTYVNNLRLNEMGTGDASGTWGNTTNTNLELIGEALGFGTEAITTNADTHTTTVADGASDAGRAMYLKYTGTLDSACTITIAPNTMKRMQFIENGTSGSQNIIISQGSGANITIPAGDTKAVYLDGAGSGAAVVDAFASLNLVDLKVQDDLTVTDDLIVNGDIDLEGSIDVNGTLETDAFSINGTSVTATGAELNYSDTGQSVGVVVASKVVTADANKDVASFRNITLTGELDAGSLDVSGDADIDGTLEADAITIGGTAIASVLSPVAGSSSIVTTGALNAGSITSGFGSIDNGSSAITTTGTITGGQLTVDNITIDGTEIDLSSGSLTLDVAGNIVLDADSGEIHLTDGGTQFAQFTNSSLDFIIGNTTQDKDILLKGNDGGSVITALTLDMSSAGAATFNNDVTAFSDKRLKTDIEPITNALPKVMQMQGVYYKRNDVDNAREQVGVLAQDMEAILPEVVLTADDEMQTKSVDYGKICAVLIESIKELKAEIDELKKG